jgi:hypothetical protein
MEATERRNYPDYIIQGYTPPKGTLGILVVAPLDGCPATAPRFTSTQALRSRCVSSISKSLDAPGSCLRPLSLRYWLCGSTKEPRRFCGEPQQTVIEGSHCASGQQGDCLQLLLGLLLRVRLRIGPRRSRVRNLHDRATAVRTSYRLGYNIYTRREIRLLARPQARRPDRRELTLRRLPRLESLPGGHTTSSSRRAHSNRGGDYRLLSRLSRSSSLHEYQRDAGTFRDTT